MQDRVIKSEKIDWKQIQTLQPDNFKLPEQQEVLKKSLLANGFVSPFCVWEDPKGVIWSIDGVHRVKALTELQQQGQDIPELLTANFIEAKDRKEAGIILLEVFNSKQNKATEQGLELLKIDLDISNDDLNINFEDLDIVLDKNVDNIKDGEEIEIPQSVQVEPPQEYILVMAPPNSSDWEDLKETLQLQMVRRGGYKKNSPFDAVSLERVLTWQDFKKRFTDANSSTEQE